MKVLKCPNCGNHSAFSLYTGQSSSSLLQCPFCGYKDYGYSWTGIRGKNLVNISTQLIHEFKNILSSIPDGSDATGVLISFAKRYNLSTKVLLSLSRMLSSNSPIEHQPFNHHRFTKIAPGEISITDLRDIIVQQIDSTQMRSNIDAYATSGINSEETTEWELRYNLLSAKHEALKAKYNCLLDHYSAIEKELNKYKSILE